MSTLETWPDSWLTPDEARASRAEALTPSRALQMPRPVRIPTRAQRIRQRRIQALVRGVFWTAAGATIAALAWLAFTLAAIIQNRA